MGIRKRTINMMTTATTGFVIVVFMILFWEQLNTWVGGISVGIFMFFNMGFWQLLLFMLGLTFIVTLIMGFAFRSRFGGKAQ